MLSMLVCSLALTSLGLTGTDAPPDSPEALAKSIQAQVIPASLQKLDALVAGPDTTIALAAAWERVRRTTPADTTASSRARVTTEAARFQAIPGPDSAVLARFLGFVEGRLRCAIPEYWAASVGSAKYSDSRDIWFAIGEPVSSAVAAIRKIKGRVVPRREGDHWIVQEGGLSLTLPADDRDRGAEFDP